MHNAQNKFSLLNGSTWAIVILVVLLGSLLTSKNVEAQSDKNKYPNIGRGATPKEISAWDIDVRPDFKGLPVGSGSVAKGQDVWEAKCASCHGIFGESNEVYFPLIGGVTKDDLKTGHVARLNDPNFPGRTMMMKTNTVSSIWDFIRRAMPWNAPQSLTTEEVYATTAYLLNLSKVVPDDFVLSDKNIAEVQKLMPNRNGMTTQHAFWPGNEFGTAKLKPDTNNTRCMKNCEQADAVKITSSLPEYARNQSGNLKDQNRLIGSQRGVDTSKPEAKSLADQRSAYSGANNSSNKNSDAKKSANSPTQADLSAIDLVKKNNCMACHAIDSGLVGPSYVDVAKKHSGKIEYLMKKIKDGSTGVWGGLTMPPQSLSESDLRSIATWLATGAKH